MDGLISDFLTDCKLRNLTPESIVNYRSNLRIFSVFLEKNNISIQKVDCKVLKSFLNYLKNDRDNSMKRMSNYFSAISSFYDYLLSEETIRGNPVPPVRKRYLRSYKKESINGNRRAISVEEMAILLNSILDLQYKAIATLFAKTGIRRGELIRLDVDDINWKELSITLKPCKKRSNRKVFFDDECARILRQWISRRGQLYSDIGSNALFISKMKTRLQRSQITRKINLYAKNVGLHNPESKRLDERFSPHYFRHWFTTMLLRNGMRREYVKELRGDVRREAVDIYNHIDYDDLKKEYLACIPQLGFS